MRALIGAMVLLAPALAGCLSATEPSTGPPTEPPAPTGPLDLTTSMDGCGEILVLVLVDPGHARRFLPPGFEPADAAAFFGSPAAAGRAMVAINSIECEGSTLEKGPTASAELVVLVEPPEVEGATVEGALRNVYNVHQYTAGSTLVEATDGTGFAVSQVAIEAAFGPAPGGAATTGTGVLTDDEGELARFEVTVAPGLRDTATANQFQLTSTGLVVYAYAWEDGATSVGRATCTVRSGSLIADVLGTTTCEGAETVGILFGPVDFQGRFQYFPGAGVREGAP